jgi:hypothetical protein
MDSALDRDPDREKVGDWEVGNFCQEIFYFLCLQRPLPVKWGIGQGTGTCIWYNGHAVEEDCNTMASTHYKEKVYRRPTNPHIGQEAKLLYQLEDKRDDALRAATEELGKLMGLTDFFHEMLPEGLLALLDQWDRRAGEAAAVEFLTRQGYTVTKS